jgi:hypothetical protein
MALPALALTVWAQLRLAERILAHARAAGDGSARLLWPALATECAAWSAVALAIAARAGTP